MRVNKTNRKATKPQSPLQKVCMQYGRDCFQAGSTAGLIRLLKAQGHKELAERVEHAYFMARLTAKKQYFRDRKLLQPEWKNWTEQIIADLGS